MLTDGDIFAQDTLIPAHHVAVNGDSAIGAVWLYTEVSGVFVICTEFFDPRDYDKREQTPIPNKDETQHGRD